MSDGAARLRRLINRTSKKKERATARDLGGRVTPGSGNTADIFAKEDVHSKHFVLQHKFTEKKSFSIKAEDLRLCEERALRQCKMPAHRIEFTEYGEDVAIIRWQDFLQILMDSGLDS